MSARVLDIPLFSDDALLILARQMRAAGIPGDVVFMIEDRDGNKAGVIPSYFGKDASERAETARRVGSSFKDIQAVAIMLDTWMTEYVLPAGEVLPENLPLPSQSPNRVEAFTVTAQDMLTGQRKVIIDIYDRNPDTGAPIFRKPDPEVMVVDVPSNFSGILDSFAEGVSDD